MSADDPLADATPAQRAAFDAIRDGRAPDSGDPVDEVIAHGWARETIRRTPLDDAPDHETSWVELTEAGKAALEGRKG